MNIRALRMARTWLAMFVALASMICGAAAWAEDGAEGLRVESLMPQGQTPRITQIVVGFSSQMVPLGQAVPAEGDAPLRLDPMPSGSFRWLDQATLAYILDEPLSGATRIRMTIPAGTTALDGSALARTVRATVSTPAVELADVYPKPGSALGPNPELTLEFNQPVKLETLQRHLGIYVDGRRLETKVEFRPPPEWMQDRENLAAQYVVRLDKPLPPSSKARLVVGKGLAPARGNLVSDKVFAFDYKTFGRLRLIKREMGRSVLGGFDPASALMLEFNNPVDGRRLWQNLVIEPPMPEPEDGFYDTPSRWVSLNLGFKPGQTYKFTVKPEMVDDYGTKPAKAESFELKMGDFNPLMALGATSGILEPPGVLPLRVRNVPTVDLAVSRLAPEEVVPALAAAEDRPWDEPLAPLDPAKAPVRALKLHVGQPRNQTSMEPLDLPALLGRAAMGGLVVVQVSAAWPDDKGKQKEHFQQAMIQVTNLGLSLKVGASAGAAWVTALSNGAPLRGAKLELRDRKNRLLWSGVSDESGLALLPGVDQLKPEPDKDRPWRNPVVYLVAAHGPDMAVLPAEWGWDLTYELPPDVNFTSPAEAPALAAHALVQLPLYQPGQTVRFAVFLRRRTPQGLRAPQPGPVQVRVMDPYGRAVRTFHGTSNAYGTVAGSFDLGAGARLGRYSVVVQNDGKEIEAGGFRVASFRPPDFKVDLGAPAFHVGGGSAGRAVVDAQYLFGAPVAGGKAQLAVSQEAASFAPPRLKELAVGDLPLPGDEPNQSANLGNLEAALSAQGEASFGLPEAKPLPGLPVRLTLGATVSDKAGMFMGTDASLLVHPAAIYVGLGTPLLAQAAKPVEIKLLAAGIDDAPAAVPGLRLSVYRQYWETVRERGPGGFYRYLGQARREQVWQATLDLPQGGTTASFTPPQSGTYVLVAEGQDAQGRPIRSATYLWASGGGTAGWQRFDGHRLELEPASTDLRPGQTARILVKNPFERATALITVERRGVRSTRVMNLDEPAPVIEVPISESDAPGVYVGVLLVRGRVSAPAAVGLDLGKPQMRIGYCRLDVQGAEGGLTASLTTDRTEAKPGQYVNAEVRVSRGGAPAQAQITLLAVDERVLTAAGGENSYDPAATLGRLVGLGVLTADDRTQVIGKVLAAQKGEDGSGGGGLGQALRQRFHPAVFWLAHAETTAEGRFAASFKLPDTLTAYRVVAVACDKADAFAVAKAQVRVKKPLQVLSALPRFATVGDAFDARFIVQNFGDKAAQVSVEAEAQGLEAQGPSRRELTVEPGAGAVVGFAVAAKSEGSAAITVRAVAGAESDAARYTLDVLPRVPLETMAASGELKPKGKKTEIVTQIELPAGAAPGRGGLALELAGDLAPTLARPAGLLISYPWDCWEQRLSRAAARALRQSAGERLGLSPAPDDVQLIAATMAMAVDFQTGSGGFVYWRGMETADDMLTAYTLIAAGRIGQAGPKLHKEVVNRAVDYLEGMLKAKRPAKPGLAEATSEAMAVWALAEQGRDVGTFLETALRDAPRMSPFGLAALIQAAKLAGKPQAVLELTKRLEATATVSATELHFGAVNPDGLKTVMGSNLRGNAAALWALCAAAPDYPRLEGLARWVGGRLSGQAEISTQDAVFGLWAMDAYLKLSGAGLPVTGSVSLDGEQLAQRLFQGRADAPLAVEVARDALLAGKAQRLTIGAEGQGPLYWTARLAFAPEAAPDVPLNAGLRVARFLARPGGEPAPLWRMGDEVEYVLTVAVDATRHHVLVVAPYPAGLEPIRARQGAEDQGDWQWSELRRSELLLYSPVLNPGVYSYRFVLRAVSPGSFVMPPLRAEEMYAPEVFGTTAEQTVEVR